MLIVPSSTSTLKFMMLWWTSSHWLHSSKFFFSLVVEWSGIKHCFGFFYRSTIITHGMPYPNNVETAVEVEEIVREQVIELIKCCQPWNAQELVMHIIRPDTLIKSSFKFKCWMIFVGSFCECIIQLKAFSWFIQRWKCFKFMQKICVVYLKKLKTLGRNFNAFNFNMSTLWTFALQLLNVKSNQTRRRRKSLTLLGRCFKSAQHSSALVALE